MRDYARGLDNNGSVPHSHTPAVLDFIGKLRQIALDLLRLQLAG
jgi:hypothetical protein